jgi:endonuclease-3
MTNEHERILEIIKKLKKAYPDTKYYFNISNPLEVLIAAVLSAQVRDEVVDSVISKLFKKYKKAEDYIKATRDQLVKDILPVSFAGNKAKHIIGTCKILVEKYNGKVPKTMEELTSLPGVGRKTANVILANAYDIVTGIAVDTHVIRISYRLGLTKQKKPEKIEEDLLKIVPKQYWKEFQWIMKEHGRAICKAPTPICSKCFLSDICPKQGVSKRL